MFVFARRSGLVLTLLSFAALPFCSIAQTVVPHPAGAAATAAKRITIDVVVDQKNAKLPPASGLRESDFSLLDNKTPRPFTSFRAVSMGQEPVRVVLLVDDVNIRLDGLANERNRISEFLKANGGHLAHPTTIAILTDTGLQLQEGFSTDGNAMSEALEKQNIGMRTIRDDTGIYGAEDRMNISLNALRNLAAHEAQEHGRTILLWVSPGWPLLSGPGVQLSGKNQEAIFNNVVGLSTQLREAHVTLYAIDPIGANEGLGRTFYYQEFLKGISKSSQVDIGDLSLQVLAMQSGGLALNSNDTAGLLTKSVADLDNYYEISFEPAPAETRDTYHHLEITVDKPGLTARTRDGYYAQP
jgi:VWFA-related protein